MNTAIKRLSAFNYFGGKGRYLDWLLPLLPDERTYFHYCEPFCGAASLLLNKKPSPIETISDADGRLINFFTVLRDRPDELIRKLKLTGYSRNEFQRARTVAKDPVEDARRFFVRTMQCFGGGGTGEESRRVNSFRLSKSSSRLGKAGDVSKWLSKIDGLEMVVERLRSVQMENRDALHTIRKMDSKDTFFYCDPPYVHETRTGKTDYNHELTNEQHEELAALLHSCKGKVAISGYEGRLMNAMYGDWHKHVGPERMTNIGRKAGLREVLWTNYDPFKQPKFLFA